MAATRMNSGIESNNNRLQIIFSQYLYGKAEISAAKVKMFNVFSKHKFPLCGALGTNGL